MAINKNNYLDGDGDYDLKKALIDELIDGVNDDSILISRGGAPTDISQITQAGIYSIGGTHSNFIGSSAYYGFLTVKKRASNSSDYLLFSYANNAGDTWVASKWNNTMSDWSQQWSARNSNVMTESGSNTNGSYVRFSDGTMICHRTIPLVTDISTVQGVLFRTSGFQTWTFPVTFQDTPKCFSEIQSGGLLLSTISEITTTNAKYYPISSFSRTSIDLFANLFAIGRWK